jgi:hypothetical protein
VSAYLSLVALVGQHQPLRISDFHRGFPNRPFRPVGLLLTLFQSFSVIPAPESIAAAAVKTIDRYLLARYFYIFAVFFTAAMGLFIIADGFTNLDDFQHRAGDGGTRALLASMGQHYL